MKAICNGILVTMPALTAMGTGFAMASGDKPMVLR